MKDSAERTVFAETSVCGAADVYHFICHVGLEPGADEELMARKMYVPLTDRHPEFSMLSM